MHFYKKTAYFIILVFLVLGCENIYPKREISSTSRLVLSSTNADIGKTAYLVKTNKTATKILATNSGAVRLTHITAKSAQDNTTLYATTNNLGEKEIISRTDIRAYEKISLDTATLHSSRSANTKSPTLFSVGSTDTKNIIKNPNANMITAPVKMKVRYDENAECRIWVPDSDFGIENNLTQADVKILADKFTALYTPTRNLMGEESNNFYRSSEISDTKINIIAYKMEGNTEDGGIFGYFFPGDYIQGYSEDGTTGNDGKYFYVDTYFAKKYPDIMYSTLIHEFTHMINFGQKTIQHNAVNETWFTEMLAMTAEDAIQTISSIGIDESASPRATRVRDFTKEPGNVGLTEWNNDKLLYLSYANAYMLGAYFARNYGGADFIKKIATNDAQNEDSITLALREKNPNESFVSAVSKFPEALLFLTDSASSGKKSFNNEVKNTINGTNFTFKAINLKTTPSKKISTRQEDVPGYSYSIQQLGIVGANAIITINNPNESLEYSVLYTD